MGEVTRLVKKCDRCGHEWLPRDEENPLRCAKCKSPYWNRPKTLPTSKNLKKRNKT